MFKNNGYMFLNISKDILYFQTYLNVKLIFKKVYHKNNTNF
jgi:hypothetical protein